MFDIVLCEIYFHSGLLNDLVYMYILVFTIAGIANIFPYMSHLNVLNKSVGA